MVEKDTRTIALSKNWVLHWSTNGIIFAALLLAVLLTIPLNPQFPGTGLDLSWQYALNEAIARHLVFGQDIVFTFGPLAPVYTGMYHPATDWIMVFGSALFGAGLCIGLALLAYPRRLLLLLILPILMVVNRNAVPLDAAFIVLPFVLLALIVRVCNSDDECQLRLTPGTTVGVAVVVCAVAILPLVKGSFALTAFCSIALSLLVLLRRSRSAAICFAILILTTVSTAWTATGQPIAALPTYFLSQGPIISGYTQAMCLNGSTTELLVYSGVAISLAVIFYQQFARRFLDTGMIALVLLGVTLFVGFKSGFVRHDGHALIAAGVVALTGYSLSLLLKPAAGVVALILSIFGWGYIEHMESGLDFRTVTQRIEHSLVHTYEGIRTRILAPRELNVQFERANAAIRAQQPITPIDGTVDVYSYDLATIFAHQLNWDPRPIFQSYSVYNTALDTRNRNHLESAAAPRNILFAVQPIDNRLPALEDASSWPALLTDYKISGFDASRLRLKRVDQSDSNRQVFGPEMTAIPARVHTSIELPNVPGPLWAKIDLSPTLFGRVMEFILKIPQVQMTLTLQDGRVVRRRYIPAMGQSGFLISPYIETTEDFALLAAGVYETNRVRSVQIELPSTRFWSSRFTVHLRRLDIEVQPLPKSFSRLHRQSTRSAAEWDKAS